MAVHPEITRAFDASVVQLGEDFLRPDGVVIKGIWAGRSASLDQSSARVNVFLLKTTVADAEGLVPGVRMERCADNSTLVVHTRRPDRFGHVWINVTEAR